jgi:putative serine protease PepD
MTAGYDAPDPATPGGYRPPEQDARQPAPQADRPGPTEPVAPVDRPAPLPPRIDRPITSPPGAAYPHAGSPSQPPFGTAAPSSGPSSGHPSGPSYPTGQYPAVQYPTAHVPATAQVPPAAGYAGPATIRYPASMSGAPSGAVPRGTPRRGGVLGIVAFVLAVLLLVVAGVQAYSLVTLDRELTRTDRTAAAERKKDADRIAALEERIKELEKRAGNTLDAQAVASDVVPSVFRVTAGEFSGTAFAIGKEADGGGTNLLTNFHVVEDLYRNGGRDVALEHTNARFQARIVRVDEANDLAVLQSDEKFPRLVAASEPAKPGQPVVVVGAPLGLSDTITTGVVSAVRTTPDGPVLQFDAPINPGNSGGPVINAQRQVVGIATAKARNAEGIGLAIPIAVACDSLKVC